MSEFQMPEPDDIGVGGVTCRCGNVTLSDVKATWGASWSMQCPSCQQWVEAMAVQGEPQDD